MEKLPNADSSESERNIVTKLREKGPYDPETQALLLQWRDKQEAIAKEANTSRANLKVDLAFAKLLCAAEYYTDALEYLEPLRQAAYDEGWMDLFDEVESLLDVIDRGRNGN